MFSNETISAFHGVLLKLHVFFQSCHFLVKNLKVKQGHKYNTQDIIIGLPIFN